MGAPFTDKLIKQGKRRWKGILRMKKRWKAVERYLQYIHINHVYNYWAYYNV